MTSAQHRTTKTGKPFGVFTIEDYTGSAELALFSDDYLKFKQYLEPEYFLYIKSKVQTRFNSSDQLEVKIHTIKLLPEVGNALAKSLTVSIDLEKINANSVIRLDKIFSEYPGKLPVKFSVRDNEQRVELASKNVKVNFNKKLFEQLEADEMFRLRINI